MHKFKKLYIIVLAEMFGRSNCPAHMSITNVYASWSSQSFLRDI